MACPIAVALAALAASMAMAAAPSTAMATPQAVTSAVSGTATEVTLVTGDRIRISVSPDGINSAEVDPRYARPGISYYERTIPGPGKQPDLLIIPSDAAGLVASGELDENLFDVSELVRDGYDDRASATLPLIVSYRGAASAARSAVPVVRELPSINGATVTEAKVAARAFWAGLTRRAADHALVLAPQVAKVWLDGKVYAALGTGPATAHAEAGPARTTAGGEPSTAASSYNGTGILVADLDSGYDPSSPALAGVVTAARDFTGSADGTADKVGHGTWTASIIAGSGADSGDAYQGVAPGARLLIGKVLGDRGTGTDSDVIAGMQWAVAQHARIVNMSLGDGAPWMCQDGTDPVSQALDSLTEASGTLFVVAAGNTGQYGAGSVNAPGAANDALTVGAVDSAGAVASFSSVGPRCADDAIKPDITALGVGVTGARAAGTALGSGDGIPGDGPVSAYYTRASGTSGSAPYVTGAAADLAQEHPDWDAAQLKAALMGSATPRTSTSVDAQGDGQADLPRALRQDAYATPGSVAELLHWPHTLATTITVTYHNPGTTPLALSLALAMTGPDGKAAPAGMFAVSPLQVTVAPGATVQVPVAVKAALGTDGRYRGWLTATSPDGTVLHTAVAMLNQPRLETITFREIDRTGQGVPASQAAANGPAIEVISLATGQQEPVLVSPSGVITATVPPGEYDISDGITTAPSGSVTLEDYPSVTATRDMTLTFDARRGIPAAVTVDRQVGAPWQFAGVNETAAGTQSVFGVYAPPGVPVYAVPTPRVAGRPYEFLFTSYASNAPAGGTATVAYSLEFPSAGRIPGRLSYRVHDRSLATVRETFRQEGERMTFVDEQHYALGPDEAPFGYGAASEVIAPASGTVVEFFTPGSWQTIDYYVLDDNADWAEQGPAESYRAGRAYTEDWGAAALSTASATTRLGDVIAPDILPDSASAPGHLTADVDPAGLTGTITLHRGSVSLGTSSITSQHPWSVPAGTASYTLAMSARRDVAWSSLGITAQANWTFRSGHVGGNAPVALPLWDVRISGAFDSLDRAPAGRPFMLTIAPDLPTGALHARVTSIAVRASFDDGKTWHRLVLRADGVGKWTTTVTPPRGAAYVSLSSSLRDSAADSAQQTVIRAYQL